MLENVSFILVDHANNFENFNFDGVIGLGKNNNNNNSFLDSLLK